MNKEKILNIVFIICVVIGVIFIGSRIFMKTTGTGCPNPDLQGFCIEGKTLTGYVGTKRNITIPDNVEVIGKGAFSRENSRGLYLEKVIVPGTVKKIEDYGFANSNTNVIVIEEGVKEIGSHAFHNIDLFEIWFPKSIESIGPRVLDCEEAACSNTLKIHVYKGTYAEHAVKKSKPYYKNVKYIYEK